MKPTVKQAVILFCALMFLGAATGCQHTAHGAGEDIEKMGQKIQDNTE